MPIQFNCAKCRKGFTVSDAAAGKRGACKDCGHINTIPQATPSSPSAQAEMPKSKVARKAPAQKNQAMYEVTSSVNGAVFGPADKTTLHQWIKEDRITPDCKIKRVGSDRWKTASSVFPQLANSIDAEPTIQAESPIGGDVAIKADDPFAKFKDNPANKKSQVAASAVSASTANPYQAGSTSQRPIAISDEIVPTSGDIGFIISHAYNQYKSNFGPVFGSCTICFAVAIGMAFLIESLKGTFGQAGETVMAIFNFAITTYFFVGLMQVLLKAGRSQPTKIEEMFSATDRVLPAIGYIILVYLILLVPIGIIGGIAFVLLNQPGDQVQGETLFIPIVVGIVALVLFSTLVSIATWPGYFLVVDRKSTWLSALPNSLAIAKKNILQIFAVFLLAGLIGYSGILLLCVGVVFTAPLALMILACAYLNMSGQIGKANHG